MQSKSPSAVAAGLANSPATRQGDALVVDSPMGRVTVRFTERNELGVFNHNVTQLSGAVVTHPMAHPHDDAAAPSVTWT